jgi:3-hydroxyisobutyrate dehydrogenase-like beta-hydroxyacid dehydrogenase
MRIGFIGYGEAAHCISIGLNQEGNHDICAYDVMISHPTLGINVRKHAVEADVRLMTSGTEVVKNSDIVFIAVPSSYSLSVCDEIFESLEEGQIYADVSASTPSVKVQVWDRVREKGVKFVDAAMLGSLPLDKHKVPIIASGNGAHEFAELMNPHGMKITSVGERAGDASAIKLIRSIFMKGLAGLMLEMLQASEHYNVSDEVVKSIGKSLDGISFESHLNRLITGTAIHAKRRSAEIQGSIQLCKEADVECQMTIASQQKHEFLAAFDFPGKFNDDSPKKWQDILALMK